jgi:glucose/arabinose dehydrogenase
MQTSAKVHGGLLSLEKKNFMKYFISFFLTAILCFHVFSQPQLQFQPVASGFTLPLYVTHAGDERLFVVEKQGKIKIIMPGGSVNATPFLDIENIVRSSSSTSNEQGLLGLAFHPDYKNNGYFYVNYTRESPVNDGGTVIARYSVSANDSNIASPGSAHIILNIDQPYSNHNGGCIKFGNDGFLYIGMGDGGSGNDPQGYAQNNLSLLGKMLRIDINAATYDIPPSNPFYGFASVRNEIWATGVRNPWRFSFDRITQDMWMGDVGQNAIEELNFEPAGTGGKNYGWKCYEGSQHVVSNCGTAPTGTTFPFYEYGHNAAGGYSVTGGYVYRSAKYKGAWGYYLFADAVNQHLWITDNSFTTTKAMNGTAGASNVSFGEDIYGDLYIIKHGGGTVQKIVEIGTKQPHAHLTNTLNAYTLCEGNSIVLEALFHPDLNYQWRNNGQDIPGAQSHIYDANETGNYSVYITDPTVVGSVPDSSSEISVTIIPAAISALTPTNYTADVDDAAFQITTTVQGGTFSGQGVDANGLFTPSQAGVGTHEIIYTVDTIGCQQRDTAYVEVTQTVGMASISDNHEVSIFPNPSRGQFHITASIAIQKIVITDIMGKQIYIAEPNNHTVLLSLENEAKGIYFVKINSKSGSALRRIIIE